MTRASRAALLLALTLGLAALPHPAWAQEAGPDLLTPEERAYLDARGRITFVHNPLSPPLSMGDVDHTKGIVPDFRRLMQARLGISFEIIVASNGTDMIARMLNGSAEVSGTLAYSAERAQRVDFTEPYAELATFAWGAPDAAALREDGFQGARVAVVGGSTQESQARRAFPNATLVGVPSTRAGLDALVDGTVAAMVGSLPVLAYDTRLREDLQEFGPLGAPIERVELAFSTKKGDPLLHGIVSKGLASISPEERRAIFIKWTGHDLSPEIGTPTSVDRRTLGYVTGGLVLVALLVGVPLWIGGLRRRVARATGEIRGLNEALEARVAERTRELEIANRELESFVDSLSHDLRGPLRAIDGFSMSLLEGTATTLAPEQRADLARVRAASQRMGTLIDEVLDLNRVSRAPMRLEDVDVSARAGEILGRLRAREPQRDVEVRVEPGLRAHADPALLEALLSSLLENAWKFTSQRERAHIDVRAESTPRGAALCVQDDGAGFDPEFARRLFLPFQRLHGEPEFAGRGVGLALAKRIVALHGGEIWAEGKPGVGATFRFILPSKPPARSAP